jgi:WD40 repeat protein/serine/threonine protein kinase
MESLIGKTIDQYLILEKLNQSDWVTQYRAFQQEDRQVVVFTTYTHSSSFREQFRQRLEVTFPQLNQLVHQNLLRLIAWGEAQDFLYIVSEYSAGIRLADRLVDRFAWAEAARILLPIIKIIGVAHEQGLFHGSLEPKDIILGEDGDIHLAGFGINRLLEEEQTRETTGTIVGFGKPEYLSPEKSLGKPQDHRADLYAVGSIFYEMVTGTKLFAASNGMEVVIKQVTTEPVKPSLIVRNLPEVVEEVILRAVKKNPEERIAIAEMDLWMEAFSKGQTTLEKPETKGKRFTLQRVLAVFGVIALVAVGGFFAWNSLLPDVSSLPEPVSAASSQTPTRAITATVSLPAPTHTQLVQSTREPTPTPLLREDRMQLPVLAQTPLPQVEESLTLANVDQIHELARWGDGEATDLAWLTDTQFAISTTAGISIYDTGIRELISFIPANEAILCMVSREGSHVIATGNDQGEIHLWDYPTGELLQVLGGHSAAVRVLTFSPDGKQLASGSDDQTVKIWDLSTFTQVYSFNGHTASITDLAYRPDGKYLATSSLDGTFKLWRMDTGQRVLGTPFTANHPAVYSLTFYQDGTRLAVGGANNLVERWDTSNIEEPSRWIYLNPLLNGSLPVSYVETSSEGRILVVGAIDGTMSFYEPEKSRLILGNPVPLTGRKPAERLILRSVDFSFDGNQVLALTQFGAVDLVNTADHTLNPLLKLSYHKPQTMVFSHNIRYLAVQEDSDIVRVWDVTTGQQLQEIEGQLPKGMPFDDTSRYLTVSSLVDGFRHYKVFEIGSNRLIQTLHNYLPLGRVGYLWNNQILVAGSSDYVRMWSVSSGHEVAVSLPSYNAFCRTFTNLTDRQFLVAVSRVNLFLHWSEAEQRLCKKEVPGFVVSIGNTANEQFVAFGIKDGQVVLWDNRATDILGVKTLQGHTAPVNGVAFTPGGQILISGSADHSISLWNTESGEALSVIAAHSGPILGVAISPDGKLVATASEDGTVRVWGVR